MVDSHFEESYFQRSYRDYEAQNPQRKLEHYHQQIRTNSGDLNSVRLIDVGCGLGAFLEHLARVEPTWRLFGTDVSSHAVDACRTRVPSATIEPFLDGSRSLGLFDVVTAFDVAEHVEHLDSFADDVAALLRPKGLFVCVVPVYDGPLAPVIRTLDRDPTHVHKQSRAKWLRWAREHFELESWHGIFRLLAPGGQYIHWPTERLRSVAPAILMSARKR